MITLASKSPRRLQLLRQIGLEPQVLAVDVDESQLPAEPAKDYVIRNETGQLLKQVGIEV